MNNQAADARAALPCSADRGEGGRPDRQLERCTRCDDDGIVAPQFQESSAQPAADDFADAATHPAASSRRNQRKPRIVQHPFADVFGSANTEVEDAFAAV